MEPSIIDISVVGLVGTALTYSLGGAAKDAIKDVLRPQEVKSVESATRSREALGRVVERRLR